MKMKIKYLVIVLALAILSGGCGENEPIIYDGDLFISYLDGNQGRYVVMAQGNPYELEVGIPYPAEEDLVVGIKVVHATGQQGVQFDLPSSVTIKSGQVKSSFYIYGSFDDMTDRMDTVVIALEHEQVAGFDNEFTLAMQPPCDFVLEDFIGDFTAYEQSDYEETPYDPYTVTFSENPNGGDTLIVSGMWPGTPFKIVFNTDDPPNYTFNIPDQWVADDIGGYGETRISDLGEGVVLTCEHTLAIRYMIYVAEGYFERASIVFEKK